MINLFGQNGLFTDRGAYKVAMKLFDVLVGGSQALRAPTADVPYVSNAKYLAHLAHQTPFDLIY